MGLSGVASRWRVCYQRGLPRLVLEKLYDCFGPLLPGGGTCLHSPLASLHSCHSDNCRGTATVAADEAIVHKSWFCLCSNPYRMGQSQAGFCGSPYCPGLAGSVSGREEALPGQLELVNSNWSTIVVRSWSSELLNFSCQVFVAG